MNSVSQINWWNAVSSVRVCKGGIFHRTTIDLDKLGGLAWLLVLPCAGPGAADCSGKDVLLSSQLAGHADTAGSSSRSAATAATQSARWPGSQ